MDLILILDGSHEKVLPGGSSFQPGAKQSPIDTRMTMTNQSGHKSHTITIHKRKTIITITITTTNP
jgi:hypothetical protein